MPEMNEEMVRLTNDRERVIFLWSVPANGHLNPTLCFTNQLLLNLDEMNVSRIVFYSCASFKDMILNLPNNQGKAKIEFRDYQLAEHKGTENLLKLFMNFDTRPGSLFRVFKCYENSVKLGSELIFENLITDIRREQPVLILYDQALFFPKLVFEVFAKRYNCEKPLHGCYVTTFMCAKGVYPKWNELEEMGLLGNQSDVYSRAKNMCITVYDFCKYVLYYYKVLWWDLDFSLSDLVQRCEWPLSKSQLIDDNLNIVFVLPQLQPRLKKFESSNIKFVGPSVDEAVRNVIVNNKKIDMNKYVDMIEKFLENNVKPDEPEMSTFVNCVNEKAGHQSWNAAYEHNETTRRLFRADSTGDNFKKAFKPIIYVSMGTVFQNENAQLFRTIVQACKRFVKDYAIIVSTGDEKTYEEYTNSDLNCSSILFIPHTPQIEILKRASLFITHAGMNSVSEAINYGVPIICLPLSGDQPFVAWRVADELKIGIRLQPNGDLTVERVEEAISTILNNQAYRDRALELSDISKSYCGYKAACEHTVKFVKENESRHHSLHSSFSGSSEEEDENPIRSHSGASSIGNVSRTSSTKSLNSNASGLSTGSSKSTSSSLRGLKHKLESLFRIKRHHRSGSRSIHIV